MNKKAGFFFLLLLGFAHTAYSSQSMISKVYCLVLGNHDAHADYKTMVYNALKDMGVDHPESVPVKQMNGIGPAFARIDISSFTAFGIWLDEAYLDTCSEEEKLFHIYHEAAHFVQKHHQKLLAECGISLGALTGLMKLGSAVVPGYAVLGIGVLVALGGYWYVLPYAVKTREKQADLLAAETLTNLGKENVVAIHIEDLKKAKHFEEPGLWWYSNKEEVEYLENLKKAKALLMGSYGKVD